MDLAAEDSVYEVDRLSNFHDGIGQALHYRHALKRKGAFALIAQADHFRQQAELIDTILFGTGFQLIVLVPAVVPLET